MARYTKMGVVRLFSYTLDSAGFMVDGITDTAPTAGSQTGTEPYRLHLAKQIPAALAPGEVLTQTGDNGVGPSFNLPAADNPSGDLTLGAYDPVFNAYVTNTLLYAQTNSTMVIEPIDPQDFNPQSVGLIYITPAKDGASGSDRWVTTFVLSTQAQPRYGDAIERQIEDPSYTLTLSKSSTFPWGEAISASNVGSSGLSQFRYTLSNPVFMNRFTGDGTETSFNLSFTPIAGEAQVYVNGVEQTLTTAYTIDTANDKIDFVAAPAASSKIVVVYQFDSADM